MQRGVRPQVFRKARAEPPLDVCIPFVAENANGGYQPARTRSPRRRASPTQRRIICRALQENGIHAAIECGSGADALVRLAAQSFDLVISSLYLPDMTGTDLVHRIRESADFLRHLSC